MFRRVGIFIFVFVAVMTAEIPRASAITSAEVCDSIRQNEQFSGTTVTTTIAWSWFDYDGSMPKECGARPMQTSINDVNYWPGFFDVSWGNATVHLASFAGFKATGYMNSGWLTNFDVAVAYSIQWRDYCIACLGYSKGIYTWQTMVEWRRSAYPCLLCEVPPWLSPEPTTESAGAVVRLPTPSALPR